MHGLIDSAEMSERPGLCEGFEIREIRKSGDIIQITCRIAGWVCTSAEHLRKRDEKDFASMMHLHENTGRPLGNEGFVKKPETTLGRMLTPGKPGRLKKATIEN